MHIFSPLTRALHVQKVMPRRKRKRIGPFRKKTTKQRSNKQTCLVRDDVERAAVELHPPSVLEEAVLDDARSVPGRPDRVVRQRSLQSNVGDLDITRG